MLSNVILASLAVVGASAISLNTGVQPPQPSVTALPGTLALGELCSVDEQCANSAQCWASNVMVARRCGGFNASCKQDSQCAGTTCVDRLCRGPPKSSSTTSCTTATSTSTSAVNPTSVTKLPSSSLTTSASVPTTSSTYIINGTNPITYLTTTTSKPISYYPSTTLVSTTTYSSPIVTAPFPTGSAPGGGSGAGSGSGGNSTVTPPSQPNGPSTNTPPPYTGGATPMLASGSAVFAAALMFALAL